MMVNLAENTRVVKMSKLGNPTQTIIANQRPSKRKRYDLTTIGPRDANDFFYMFLHNSTERPSALNGEMIEELSLKQVHFKLRRLPGSTIKASPSSNNKPQSSSL